MSLNLSLFIINKSINLFFPSFGKIHHEISISVCIFGLLANFVNFIVLTRKEMLSSVNMILSALACSDFLVMIIYFTYCVVQVFHSQSRMTKRWETWHIQIRALIQIPIFFQLFDLYLHSCDSLTDCSHRVYFFDLSIVDLAICFCSISSVQKIFKYKTRYHFLLPCLSSNFDTYLFFYGSSGI